ncbi:hypothetical protein, partial [Pseudomonas syringae]|uniref:hypothetical protein n=1 Tax=Pseudomonas syringae TaxID=317 RepID=UPI001F1E8BF1
NQRPLRDCEGTGSLVGNIKIPRVYFFPQAADGRHSKACGINTYTKRRATYKKKNLNVLSGQITKSSEGAKY